MLKTFLASIGILILIAVVFYARPYGVGVRPFGRTVEEEEIYRIAAQKSDISVCDRIHLISFADVTNRELRRSCYEYYVGAHPDQDVCPRIGNPYGCISAAANEANDPSRCLSLADEGYRALCVFDFGKLKHDSSFCKILSTTDEQKRCKQHFISEGING